ncbi:MAG: hypothetical protein IPM49_15045 [Flavobacteriales bacterium]|nr:hypothetical protein [Flavobacteriales bacterium]
MKHPVRAYLLSSVLLAFAGSSAAQQSSPAIELIEYTNDSLGFKIDLPCDPQWQKPSIPGSKAVLVCAATTPMVIINSERRSFDENKAFDEYVRKQVQVGAMPYELTREKLDGHKARRVRLSANGQDVELWVVATKTDRLHMFSFVQPSGQLASAIPSIVASIRLK